MTLPHRNYDLQQHHTGQWIHVVRLDDYTRREAEIEMQSYCDCNPGVRFRLVVAKFTDSESEKQKGE